MNAEDAIAVLAATDPAMGVPKLRPEDVLGIVEIPLRHGGYAEVYVALAWEPAPDGPAAPFGVTVFQFEHAGAEWRWVTAMCERTDDDRRETLERARRVLEAEQATNRPAPFIARGTSRRKPATGEPKRMDEEEAFAPLVGVGTGGTVPRASHADVDEAERAIGTQLPAGYRTYVVERGVGTLSGTVRIYGPTTLATQVASWRARIEQHWFWGETPIDHAGALEGICIGDTVDGHEIISLPGDPDLLFLLPRGSERARKLGRGLGAALRKLVKKPGAKLER
jgi:hypothetical protein